MENKRIYIMGVPLDCLDKKSALEKIEEFLATQGQKRIITPNPEFILEASENEEFFYCLEKADLSLLDGFGLKLVALCSGENIERIPGADFVKDVLSLAEKRGDSAAVINWRRGLSSKEEIEKALAAAYPRLSLAVFDSERDGEGLDRDGLKNFSPRVILVNFGAPYQDIFILKNLKDFPSARIGLGVGGALDFLTGRAKRAPRFFRFLGLEWLWRLLKQPKKERLKRIVAAVIFFPLKFLSYWLKSFFYRPNVACLVYKKDNKGYKILIVERSDDRGHWQLPQGGTDGEGIEAAALREVEEELGTRAVKIIKIFKNLYQYKFLNKQLAGKGKGYKGQRQGLAIIEFLGEDKDIKINYWDHASWRWVKAEDLVTAVHDYRKPGAKIFMEKFSAIIGDKK